MMEISKKKLKIYIAAAFGAGIVIAALTALFICKGMLGFVAVSADRYESMSNTY